MKKEYHVIVSDRSQEQSGDQSIPSKLKIQAIFSGDDAEELAKNFYDLMTTKYLSYHDISLYSTEVQYKTELIAEKYAKEIRF